MQSSYVTDLYGEKFDFPPRRGSPVNEYMLAALPRSGSTYLALELWRTGVMGAPMEYANPPFMELLRQRLGIDQNLAHYWQEVGRHRTSSNGVFGFKMFIANWRAHSREHPELLSCLQSQKAIVLTRSDVLQQAVSYSRALRSGVWFKGTPGHRHRIYDARHIYRSMIMLRFQSDFWNELLSLAGAIIYHLTYEELLIDTPSVIKRIADFLGVEQDARAHVDLPHLQIQRDADSAEWVRRFRDEDLGKLAEEYDGSEQPPVRVDDRLCATPDPVPAVPRTTSLWRGSSSPSASVSTRKRSAR